MIKMTAEEFSDAMNGWARLSSEIRLSGNPNLEREMRAVSRNVHAWKNQQLINAANAAQVETTTAKSAAEQPTHWGYHEVGEEEGHHCQVLETREEAIDEGMGETEGDEFVVYECKVGMPPLHDFDVEETIERYTQVNDDRLWDDYAAGVYGKDWQLLPEPLAELEAAVKPHWEAISAIFLAWMEKHCGKVHNVVKEEHIERVERVEEGEGKDG